MEALNTIQEAQRAMASDRALIYKHSIACGRSATALEQVGLIEDTVNIPIYFVDVLGNADVSHFIAQVAQIKHESPQILLVVRGEPVWEAHHWDVTEDNLKKALAHHTL